MSRSGQREPGWVWLTLAASLLVWLYITYALLIGLMEA